MNPHLPPPHRQQPPSHNHPRYDAENRLVSIDNGATTYGYDADGQRVFKTTAGALTDFIYDRDGHIILTNPSSPTQVELYAGGMHLATKTLNAQQTDTNTYFDHADWLGTERARTDWSGKLCETVASLPFGDGMAPLSTCSEGDVSPMHFTGKERNTESGLDNFGARYFGSGLGRFMSPDPDNAGADPMNPESWNMFSYVLNNPLINVDPYGLNCVWEDGSYDSNADPDTGSSDKCKKAGGAWVDESLFKDENLPDWSRNGDKELAALYDQITDPIPNASELVNAPDPNALPTAAAVVFSEVSRDTYAFNRDVTCVAAVVKPFLPAPDPDSLSGTSVDSTKSGAEVAEEAAQSAVAKIKQARRIGPSRLARIAKLEKEAEIAGKTAKALDLVGYVFSAKEAYENAKEYCTGHK